MAASSAGDHRAWSMSKCAARRKETQFLVTAGATAIGGSGMRKAWGPMPAPTPRWTSATVPPHVQGCGVRLIAEGLRRLADQNPLRAPPFALSHARTLCNVQPIK